MSLKEIFCQDKATAVIQRAFAADKLAHAYIFSGRDGVGKSRTAFELSKLLLCEKPVIENNSADSCGLCRACKLFQAGSHPDFTHVYKELREYTEKGRDKGSPVDLPIDVIRQFLVKKVCLQPTVSSRRIFVVSESEKLNVSSQNSLLKVLEEPPAFCSIFLLCSRPEKLLPTIKSRCQIVRFGPISEEKIIRKLKDTGLDEKKCRYFARLSAGSLGAAIQLAGLQTDLYQTKRKLITSLVNLKYAGSVVLAEKFLQETKKIAAAWFKDDKKTSRADINRRAAKTIITIITSAFYDAMKLSVAAARENLVNFDQTEEIARLAAHFGPERAADAINLCCQTSLWIEAGVNERLIFDRLLLKLADSGKMPV